MARVTELRRVPGAVRVSFDDGNIIPVPSPLFRLYPLKTGQTVDPDAWRSAWEKQSMDFALDRAGTLLSVRDASEKEVADRLRQSGYPETVVARTMQLLIGAGYVNNTRYAEHFVETRSRRYGSRRLYAELRQKGISESTARSALDGLPDESEEQAVRLQAEKLSIRKDLSDPEVRRKLILALVRRGFSWDTAKEAIENLSDIDC